MAVIVNEKANNYPIPDEGQYLAVVADVIDLGPVSTSFGTKDKVQIVWLLDAYDGDSGDQFRVSSFYNKSLHEKATLRKDLKSILGQDVSGSFDLESLLGFNSNLVIQHNESDGKTYANIVAFLKVPKGTKKLLVPEEFERKIDKDGTGSSENPVNTAAKKKTQPKLETATKPAQTVQTTQTAQFEPRQQQSQRPSSQATQTTIKRTVRQAPVPAPPEPEPGDPITDEDIPF